MSFFKKIAKVGKVAVRAVAAYYTAGASEMMLQRQRQEKKIAEAQAAAAAQYQAQPSLMYSAPFNPGYSYTGPPDAWAGAGFQVGGGTGGAAVPTIQTSSDNAPSGFVISPIMALGALVLLMFGFLLLRR